MLKWFKEKFNKENSDKLEVEKESLKAEEIKNIDEIRDDEEKENINQCIHEEASFIEKDDSLENEVLDENIILDEIEPKKITISEKNEETGKMNFFQSLRTGLSKTRKDMSNKINSILGNFVKIDDEMLEELEEILISADIGMETTMTLIDNLKETIMEEKVKDPQEVQPLLKREINKLMESNNFSTDLNIETSPTVILVVGVNGVGKTTTIGKLASQFKNQGKKVLIVAADTFRAAAIDQLKLWGERSATDVIAQSEGSDPAAVVFDGIQAAKSRNIDVLICDTAGRLHNKSNLMQELSKISRVIEKEYPEANRETILVLDATTGQNALNQAKVFKEATNLTGIALTKLDGTAKGGIVISLQSELGVPIKLIGVGEGINDLQKFDSKDFINAIFD